MGRGVQVVVCKNKGEFVSLSQQFCPRLQVKIQPATQATVSTVLENYITLYKPTQRDKIGVLCSSTLLPLQTSLETSLPNKSTRFVLS